MNWNEEAEAIMNERFGGDSLIALATSANNIPWVRGVNATYQDGCFYIITHNLSQKMDQIRENPVVAISGDWFTCHGIAESLGWFRREDNREIAAKLWQAFSSWIENGHNNFDDENTIILRVRVTDALLMSHGRAFRRTETQEP